MFKKILVFSFIIAMLTTSKVMAGDIKEDSIQTVIELVRNLTEDYEPQDILVCFDVDLTLTVTNEVAAQWPSIQNHKKIFKEVFQTLSPLEGNTLLNLSTKTQEPVLIEGIAPKVIKELISKGVKVIALTDSMTGTLGDNQSVKDWRVNELEKLGISFHGSFPKYDLLKFNSLTEKTRRHPEFYRGVLLTDSGGHKDVTKGTVLVSFLKEVHYTPKVVIMFDDRAKYLDIVKVSLEDFDSSINFIGIEYTGGHVFSTGKVSPQEFKDFWTDLAQKAKSEVAQSGQKDDF